MSSAPTPKPAAKPQAKTGLKVAIAAIAAYFAGRIAVTVLLLTFVFGIGATVYFGTVVKPGQDLAATKQACATFAEGKDAAEKAFLDEASRTDQAPSELTAVTNYMAQLYKGTDAAFKQSVDSSDVQNALVQVSVKRLSVQANQGQDALMALDTAANDVTNACASALAGK